MKIKLRGVKGFAQELGQLSDGAWAGPSVGEASMGVNWAWVEQAGSPAGWPGDGLQRCGTE